MCQEQQTHPPMPVWLRTPRPNAPDVRPRCPPVQIILTLSACSPTGRDRRPVCVQTALVQHIDRLTTCKTSKPVFQSAFGDLLVSGGATTILGTRMNNFQSRILSPHAPRNHEPVSLSATLYAARRHPDEHVGPTSSQLLCTQKLFSCSLHLNSPFRLQCCEWGLASLMASSSMCPTSMSDAPSLSSQS